MSISFLVPLTIALVSAAVAYQTQEEIVKTFLAIGLLVGFVWAPWFVQILVLALSLGALRYFCDRHSCHKTKLR